MEMNFNINRIEQTIKFKEITVLGLSLANFQPCRSCPDIIIWKTDY